MSSAHAVVANHNPDALTDIYRPEVTLAVWQRRLDTRLQQYAQHLIHVSPHWHTRFIKQPDQVAAQLERELPLNEHRQAFIEDVTLFA